MRSLGGFCPQEQKADVAPPITSPDSNPNNSATRDNMRYRGLETPDENPPADRQLDGDRQEVLCHLCNMDTMNSRTKTAERPARHAGLVLAAGIILRNIAR